MTYSMEEVKEIVKNVLVDTNEVDLKKEDMKDDTTFSEDLLFDSYNYIKLVVELESKLDIIFTMEDLDIDTIRTIQQMTERTYDLYKKENKLK
ncbi:MAG: acyl carrier protein [Velocimicrobium sp.]